MTRACRPRVKLTSTVSFEPRTPATGPLIPSDVTLNPLTIA